MTKKILSTRNLHRLSLIVLAIIFFIGTGSFNRYAQDRDFVKWASPDETANYVFSKLYAESGQLKIFEKYNLSAGDIIHPRSTRSEQGQIKPVSFWGIILIYGRIARIFGAELIPYLTPFIAGLGIIFFYLLVKKIFGRVNALLSAFLLASFPPFVYYTARSLFHNVLFTVLLIMGLYFIARSVPKKDYDSDHALRQKGLLGAVRNLKKIFINGCRRLKEDWPAFVFAALGGAFIGLAAITRTSELLWVAPLFFLLWVFNIRRIGLTRLLIFLSFFVLACLPALYYNKIFNGGYFYGGYAEMNQSLVDISRAGSDIVRVAAGGNFLFLRDLVKKIFNGIFHFGFHPRQSLWMFYYYFVAMFPWIFWPGLIGLAIFAHQHLKRGARMKPKHKLYLASCALIFLVLVFYYGSWRFYDNPDPNQHTIGNSYVRYWLPVYLGLLPFVSLFIMRITKAAGTLGGRVYKRFYRDSLRAAIIFIVILLSVGFVLWSSDEGLFYLAKRQKASRAEFDRILDLTEDNAVIITRYHDKLLFPERKVVVGLFDRVDTVAEYARLARFLPLYYYNFTLPEKDIEYLNSRRLKEAGLAIEKVSDISGDFTLYRLKSAGF